MVGRPVTSVSLPHGMELSGLSRSSSGLEVAPAQGSSAHSVKTRLRFSVPVQTANGLAYAAPVRLAVVNIGNITLSNVEALVAQPGVLKESLLGMSFLSRLRSYEFSGQYLTFRN